PEHARAAGHAGGANVRVKVVEPTPTEEDRVCQGTEPRRELCRRPVGPRDPKRQERRLNGMEWRMLREGKAITVNGDRGAKWGERLRPGLARDRHPPEKLEVRQGTAQLRIRVDDDAVATGRRESDLRGDPAAGPDRR